MTKRSSVRIAAPTLFGPPASSASLPKSISPISPSAASHAEPRPSDIASVEIRRARAILELLLLREDVADSAMLADEVCDGIDRACRTLDYLAGKQSQFEFFIEMRSSF